MFSKEDIVGTRFGNLIIKRYVNSRPRAKCSYYHFYLCECDCGKEKIIERANLTQKNGTKSCGCRYWRRGEAAFNYVFHQYKQSAKRRGITFNLTKEEIRKLTKERCFYCGVLPTRQLQRADYTGAYTYNGIDRIESKKGYFKENCVTCCWICNRMKQTLKQSMFLEQVNKIYLFQTEEVTTMGKDKTCWLFVGIYKGIIGETKAFQKEEGAKQAFLDYTGYNWEEATEEEEIYSLLCEGHYNGSQVSELHIKP